MQSTPRIVELAGRNGASLPARVWQGTTDKGVSVLVFVTRVAVEIGQDQTEFDADLQEHAPPRPDVEHWPARMLID